MFHKNQSSITPAIFIMAGILLKGNIEKLEHRGWKVATFPHFELLNFFFSLNLIYTLRKKNYFGNTRFKHFLFFSWSKGSTFETFKDRKFSASMLTFFYAPLKCIYCCTRNIHWTIFGYIVYLYIGQCLDIYWTFFGQNLTKPSTGGNALRYRVRRKLLSH